MKTTLGRHHNAFVISFLFLPVESVSRSDSHYYCFPKAVVTVVR